MCFVARVHVGAFMNISACICVSHCAHIGESMFVHIGECKHVVLCIYE